MEFTVDKSGMGNVPLWVKVRDLEEQNRQVQDELALALTRIEELEARNEYEVEK